MDPRLIAIADFNYHLPEEKIAFYPAGQRDQSKLLVFKHEQIAETTYSRIAEELPAGSLLAFNNTRVIEARMVFHKSTGASIEIFCLEPHEQYADVSTAMISQGRVLWKCLIGGASKWKKDQVLEKEFSLPGNNVRLFAKYVEKRADCFIISLEWIPENMSFAEILHLAGAIPLPPYIKRKAESVDEDRYQTIYADPKGSVAAPTAGLHFTPEVFATLEKKNIQKLFLTLHVGAGTFKPVKAEKLLQHEMHREFIEVPAESIRQILDHTGNLIPVGTTSLRTLESLYWLGVKSMQVNSIPYLGQWEAYELEQKKIPVREALQSLLHIMDKDKKSMLRASTRLLIAPGYRFKLCQGIITNFHQPQSSLLLLIAALIGEKWKNVYSYALENNFRFLSYGDGCLLLPDKLH